MKKYAIVLAAGKGVRMESDMPKVIHQIFGKPMITWVLETLRSLKLDGIYIVVGYKSDLVKEASRGFNVSFVEQPQQLGTGHAVAQARSYFNDKEDIVIVLNGDVPLINKETLQELINIHISNKASATILTAMTQDPQSYGRIVRSDDGQVIKIVEKKDASPSELKICEMNSGTYCFNVGDLFSSLEEVRPDNAQHELYLTDVISILRKKNKPVHALKVRDIHEITGVNTKDELAKLEEKAANAARHQ